MLSAMETPNNTGSWDTIPIFERSQCRFKDFKSMSSSKTFGIKLLLLTVVLKHNHKILLTWPSVGS